jgi:hypothetical protein
VNSHMGSPAKQASDDRRRQLPRSPQRLRQVRRRLDLVRALGVRHGFRRWRGNRKHARNWGKRQLDVTRALWNAAAAELGAEVRELALTDKGAPPIFEFRLGDARTRVLGQLTPFVERASAAVVSDKPLTYQLLAEAGISVPEHVVVDAMDVATAASFLEQGPVPCVVKPASGSGGEGVTGSIHTASQLKRALLQASATSPIVLVERQLSGDHFRVVVLQGEILVVLRRARPRVIGDGEASVGELMWREYVARLALEGRSGLKPFRIGLDCLSRSKASAFARSLLRVLR